MRLRAVGAVEGREQIIFDRSRRRKGTELRSQYVARYPPPSAEAQALKSLRDELSLEEHEAARALGLRRSELLELETGRAIPEEHGAWERAREALREAARKRDERNARPSW